MRSTNPFYARRTRSTNGRSVPRTYNVLDLFSGIGGFSLGLERAGMTTAAFCEIDPFCRTVLASHWPSTRIYTDIRNLTSRSLFHDHVPTIDLICGGYPCQPFSVAGRRRAGCRRIGRWR